MDQKMSRKKIVLLGILIVVCVVAIYTALRNYCYGKSPCNQIGTSWGTGDGHIIFSVVETDPEEDKNAAFLGHVASSDNGKWIHGFGEATLSDNTIVNIVFVDGIKGQVNISYAIQNREGENVIIDEHGSLICLSSNWCIVRLWKSSTLLGGKNFIFFKYTHGTKRADTIF